MKKIVLSVLAILGLCIIGLIIFISVSWNREFEAPYPDISASKDSTMIARGEYLAYGPAHCATCHMPMDKIMEVENGTKLPLSGGWELSIPPGTFRAPNLTPDKETGIGNWSDQQLARALRYSVSHDNQFLMPVMPFQELSDEDLTAIISFLRSQEPVRNKVKATEYTFLGKALLAFRIVKPAGPRNVPPLRVNKEPTIEYGAYLAHHVANCYGCHTLRDEKSGEFIGSPFTGGMHFNPEPLSQGYGFISPNLTPDPETGIMAGWTEATFIHRFYGGRVFPGSPMPWGAFSRMDSVDLKALYAYIKSLKPQSHKISKVVFEPGEIIKD